MDSAAASSCCEGTTLDSPAQGAQAALEGELLPRERAVVESGPAAGRTRLRGRQAGYRQPDRMRGRIQTGVLITRLHKISKGAVAGSPAVLAVQIAAAKVLLAKSLPDLQSVTVAGDADAPLVILTRME